MPKYSGEKRDPSYGAWSKDNADTNPTEHDPLRWRRKKMTREDLSGPEDELIARIDSKSHDDEPATLAGQSRVREDHILPDPDDMDDEISDEMLARGDRYGEKMVQIPQGEQMKVKQVESDGNKSDWVEKENKRIKNSRKRNEGKGQISVSRNIKRAQKESLNEQTI